ncbi:hypothetical protein M404DRAFT_1001301, partial [Pisolithus tinctorius Marx 270]
MGVFSYDNITQKERALMECSVSTGEAASKCRTIERTRALQIHAPKSQSDCNSNMKRTKLGRQLGLHNCGTRRLNQGLKTILPGSNPTRRTLGTFISIVCQMHGNVLQQSCYSL